MLNDITIGQFFPGSSLAHKLDPRIKILLTFWFILFIFFIDNYISMAICVCTVIMAVIFSGVPLKLYLKSMKMILLLVLFTSFLNISSSRGDELFRFMFISVTARGLNNSAFIAVRLFMMIASSCVLTFTTSPTDLTDALERLMKPLGLFKIKVHEIAMMMTIALRFVPTLLEETSKIMSAQKARGADLESGGIKRRISALIPTLVPLFVSSFRRAYDLSVAMECRCYRGGVGRTRMKTLRVRGIDILACVVILGASVGVIVCNILFGTVAR